MLELRILFALRNPQQGAAGTRDHEAFQDLLLNCLVGGRLVKRGEFIAGFFAASHPDVTDGGALQVGIGLTPSDFAQNPAGIGRRILRQHKESALLHTG